LLLLPPPVLALLADLLERQMDILPDVFAKTLVRGLECGKIDHALNSPGEWSESDLGAAAQVRS